MEDARLNGYSGIAEVVGEQNLKMTLIFVVSVNSSANDPTIQWHCSEYFRIRRKGS